MRGSRGVDATVEMRKDRTGQARSLSALNTVRSRERGCVGGDDDEKEIRVWMDGWRDQKKLGLVLGPAGEADPGPRSRHPLSAVP